MGNIFCILGKFASGKTTVARALQERYGFSRIVTCTTRRKREGERDGVDYYFVSDVEFEDLASKNKLIAIDRIPAEVQSEESVTLKIKRILKLSKGVKYSKKYGVPVEKIDLANKSYVCVIEPSGYWDLVERFGSDVVKSVYLKLDDKERWLRALNREVNPNLDSIVQKHLEEYNLYDGLEEKCNKLINNVGTSDRAVLEILEYIKSFE